MTRPFVPDKPVIGILGGVGAGKSTVASEFAALGCAVIDGDAIGHELLACPGICRRLRARWGEGIFLPDGAVDRGALGRIVFAEPRELAALNAIMHPAIRRRMQQQIARLRRRRGVTAIVLDAAVLLEAGWDDLCTDLLFVRAARERRLQRAQKARGWDAACLARREKAQISLDNKARECNYKIANSFSRSHLREQVREIFRRIVRPADGP